MIQDDSPLALSELKDRLSEETFQWLKEDEDEKAESKRKEEEEGAGINSLFGRGEEESYSRVETWTSSRNHPDGFGGIYHDGIAEIDTQQPTNVDGKDEVTVEFILSDVGGGHGDDVWAASRHVANLLAHSDTCAELLGDLFVKEVQNKHPLTGKRFVELGAGAGLPSWVALKCGASLVVCTDQPIPDRIRCLAEAAQRNFSSSNQNNTHVYVVPHVWGTSVPDVMDKKLCDVVVAADCLYMPHFHDDLLQSIQNMILPGGIALLPFAIHNTTKTDRDIWAIKTLAEEKYGFHVDRLSSCQLTPQSQNMDRKRALVHMLRLSKI